MWRIEGVLEGNHCLVCKVVYAVVFSGSSLVWYSFVEYQTIIWQNNNYFLSDSSLT